MFYIWLIGIVLGFPAQLSIKNSENKLTTITHL